METINSFTTESHLLDILHFAESINLPEKDIKILDQFNTNSAKAVLGNQLSVDYLLLSK
jgi:hypothetical protein